jgi:hypothetical protein
MAGVIGWHMIIDEVALFCVIADRMIGIPVFQKVTSIFAG